MSEVIFAKTRYDYGSYIDFYSLPELCGFPIVYVDEMDLSNPDKIYITAPMNGELPYIHKHSEEYRNRKCEVIYWNLERPGGSEGLEGYIASSKSRVSEGIVNRDIVSDKYLSSLTGLHYVPLGGCESRGGMPEDKIYDVMYLSAYCNRRSFMFRVPGECHNELFGSKVATNQRAEDPLRGRDLLRTKFIFNVHQDEDQFIEPVRWAVAADYGMPILTETVVDAFPYTEWHDYIQASLDDMGNMLLRAINDPYDVWRVRGKELKEKMSTEFSFRNCLEAYL